MKTFIIGTLVPYSVGQALLTIAVRPFSNPGRLFQVSGEDKPNADGSYRQLPCNKRASDATILCVAITGEYVEVDDANGHGQIKNANILEYLLPLEAIKWHEEMGGKPIADFFPDKHVR